MKRGLFYLIVLILIVGGLYFVFNDNKKAEEPAKAPVQTEQKAEQATANDPEQVAKEAKAAATKAFNEKLIALNRQNKLNEIIDIDNVNPLELSLSLAYDDKSEEATVKLIKDLAPMAKEYHVTSIVITNRAGVYTYTVSTGEITALVDGKTTVVATI